MKPAAKALVNESSPFTGILYGGLILTLSGPKVIEFNARFGDPETEVVLPKMKSDLLKHILDLLAHKTVVPEWHDKAILGVVMASKGYPGKAEKGAQIRGLDNIKNMVFHMGTAFKDGNWITNGGRVLFVLGEGITLEEARKNAYEAVNQIESNGLFYRKDIGWQVLEIGSST
jgi:phosphoribosylamine---glycine ligase